MYTEHIAKKGLLFFLLFVTVLITAGLLLVVMFPRPAAPVRVEQPIEPESPLPVSVITYSGWVEYFNPTLGLKFYYPSQFKNYQNGQLASKLTPGDKSSAYVCINISNCLPSQTSIFEIRSTSSNFTLRKYNPVFLDIQGYSGENKNFAVKLLSGESMSLPPSAVEEIDLPMAAKALVIVGQGGEQAGLIFPQAGWVGAVINTVFPEYPAIVVQMKTNEDFSRDTFINILKTFSFPALADFPSDNQILAEPAPPRFYDENIKKDMAIIAKAVNCRYLITKTYPQIYFPDHTCSKSLVKNNPVTQKPYYYSSTDGGQGFIIKAKLSSGEIYSLTHLTNPPPTPTNRPGYRPPTAVPSR